MTQFHGVYVLLFATTGKVVVDASKHEVPSGSLKPTEVPKANLMERN